MAPTLLPAELPDIVPGRAAIQGAVHDETTGLRIPGALVILTASGQDRHRETETDAFAGQNRSPKP
ncbi:MAG: hypothetical protein H0T76_29190 [Nannocystis sp.]|nr:hypothetical protein [Nannocystis sp.]MBA3550570.1 hypothetical protein [Nannocystis sp.]